MFDRPHRFVVHYVYELPQYSSSWANRVLRPVLGGWEISGWTEAQSGQPFTIRTGADTAGIGTTTPARPNYDPGGIFRANYNSAGTIQENAGGDGIRTFYIPKDGTGNVTAPLTSTGGILANSMAGGGNLGRNTFRGPSLELWNFSLLKAIPLSESVKLQIRSDFTNLWNHNNFQNPVATMSSPAFGQNTADLISDTRQILFSGKLKF